MLKGFSVPLLRAPYWFSSALAQATDLWGWEGRWETPCSDIAPPLHFSGYCCSGLVHLLSTLSIAPTGDVSALCLLCCFSCVFSISSPLSLSRSIICSSKWLKFWCAVGCPHWFHLAVTQGSSWPSLSLVTPHGPLGTKPFKTQAVLL